jgi:CSLREA domain-containing protein
MWKRLGCAVCLLALAGGLGGALPAARAEPAQPTASFTVNSPADAVDAAPGNGVCETAPGNNICTLRAAIQETNALTGTDTVLLPALPPGSMYLFALAGAGENAAATGDLDITSQLTLQGGGAANTLIDANGAVTGDRAFDIRFGAVLTLTGVTVRHGQHPTLGAGLVNQGRLVLRDSVVMSNTMTGITANDEGGGLVNLPAAVSDLERVVFQGNVSSGQAGAIWNGGVLTVSASLIVSNAAGYFGGGIYTSAGNTTIHTTTFEGNQANWGGGLGQCCEAAVALRNSAVLSNTAEFGGGGAVFGGHLTARNSTFSSNESASSGGGLYLAIPSTTTLLNATVWLNFAGEGSTGGGLRVETGAVANLRNSLLDDNYHRTGTPFLVEDNCAGTLASQDYNLVGALTGCNVAGPNPPGLLGVMATGVGPLGQHGGPTLTVRLSAGSTAVDAANPLGCTDEFAAPLAGDQRGYVARAMDGDSNGGAICDVGAFELGAASPFTWLPLVLR